MAEYFDVPNERLQIHDQMLDALEQKVITAYQLIAALDHRVTVLEGEVPNPPDPPLPPEVLVTTMQATLLDGDGGRATDENPAGTTFTPYLGYWNAGFRKIVFKTEVDGKVTINVRHRNTLSAVRTMRFSEQKNTLAGYFGQNVTFLATAQNWADDAWLETLVVGMEIPAGTWTFQLDCTDGSWMDVDYVRIVSSVPIELVESPELPPPDPEVPPTDPVWVEPPAGIGSAGTETRDGSWVGAWTIDAANPVLELNNRTLVSTSGEWHATVHSWVDGGTIRGPGVIRLASDGDGRGVATSQGMLRFEGDVVVEAGPEHGAAVQVIGGQFGSGQGIEVAGRLWVRPRPDAGLHMIGGRFGHGPSGIGWFGVTQNVTCDIAFMSVEGVRQHVTSVDDYSDCATDGGGVHLGDTSTAAFHVDIDYLQVRDVDGPGATQYRSPGTAHIKRAYITGVGKRTGHPGLPAGVVLTENDSAGNNRHASYCNGTHALESWSSGGVTYGPGSVLEAGVAGDVTPG